MVCNLTIECASPARNVRHSSANMFVTDVADFLRELRRAALDPYRPAQHYMRGPGPRWRERHALTCGAGPARASTVLGATAPLP
jgi:hypothetical protein